VQDRRPDRAVGGDEEDVPVGAAEGEVHCPGKADLAEERAVGVEHVDTADRGCVDAALRVDLEAVGMARRPNREDAPPMEACAFVHVERDEIVRPAVVGDVEGLLVGREGEPVGLVEQIRDRCDPIGPGVVAIDEVADLGREAKALKVAVARVGEPDRAVAADNDVVGRVETEAAKVLHQGLGGARRRIDAADASRALERSLLADDERSVPVEEQPVCDVRVAADGPDPG
jgi:hypothetical protein